jgi:hypothetical protein
MHKLNIKVDSIALGTINIHSIHIAPSITTTMMTNEQFLTVIAQVEAQLNDTSSLSPLTLSPASSYYEPDVQPGNP